MSEVQNSSEKSGDMVINEKTIEALIVRFIPTSQYFEKRFDHLEDKFDYKFEVLIDKFKQLETSQQALKVDIDRRFEQVDKRFEQVDAKLDKIIERIDKRIDEGLRENRSQSFRLFTFAMTFSAISMVGMLGRLFNIF
jgi:predicted transcriptional regulator